MSFQNFWKKIDTFGNCMASSPFSETVVLSDFNIQSLDFFFIQLHFLKTFHEF